MPVLFAVLGRVGANCSCGARHVRASSAAGQMGPVGRSANRRRATRFATTTLF